MRYIGYIRVETKDEGIVSKPVYVAVNMRGFNSRGTVVREFGLDKSIIAAYNELNIVKDEEAYLNELGKDNNAVNIVYIPKGDQLIMTDKLDVEQNEDEGGKENVQGTETWQGTERPLVEEEEFPFVSDEGTVFSTEPEAVAEIVKEMGIVDWAAVTKSQWQRLRDAYSHCKL